MDIWQAAVEVWHTAGRLWRSPWFRMEFIAGLLTIFTAVCFVMSFCAMFVR